MGKWNGYKVGTVKVPVCASVYKKYKGRKRLRIISVWIDDSEWEESESALKPFFLHV